MDIIKQYINGLDFKNMVISAANNLINHKTTVDELNVFPVPDGDTGTNMSLTAGAVKTALKNIDDSSVSVVADECATASLRGARGNSGVILSQFFRGLAKGLKDVETADVTNLINAMRVSKETAYRAVMKPQEGTILTVARQMHEAAEQYDLSENLCITEFLKFIVKKGNESLESTPEMLPQLKQAGVVDSGGKGLMVLVEGALYYLENGVILALDSVDTKADEVNIADTTLNPDDIKFEYCTEFIICKKESKSMWKKLRSKLEFIGDCVIVIDDKDIIKVHVHSNNPGIAIEEALKLGSLVDIKIDNLKEQALERANNNAIEETLLPHLDHAFISVASGDGIVKMMEEIGVNGIIKGGQTMNPSTDDFINEINKLNADNIYIFPNNKNIILAAEQAKNISDKNIYVVPTKSIVQGISAMLMFDETLSGEDNFNNFVSSMEDIKSASVTFAARDCTIDGLDIKKDDVMGLVEGKIKAVGSYVSKVCLDIISLMVDSMSASISLYKGQDVTSEDADELKKLLEEKYPSCDVNVYNGEQPLYYYYISVE